MNNKKFYAHSIEDQSTQKWQPLEEHLSNVSKLAGEFADRFSGENWAEILGSCHDLGKGSLLWQAYLRYVNNIIDEISNYYDGHPTHAFTGAKLVLEQSEDVGKLLSYCIAGHHGGLQNWDDSVSSALKVKLKAEYPEVVCQHAIPDFPTQFPFALDKDRAGFQLQFFTRMLFSCLVDADYLDTEKSLDQQKSTWRSQYSNINALHTKFWEEFNVLRKKADRTKVNRQREIILKDCLEAAQENPGLFSLTVPTGGGKTLASLAFALDHAQRHKKRRIIYVIPFTSIIEQNAKIFRQMLGDEVLEHHCNFLPDDVDWKSRLAAENWDAPIIVTTNVQFFDSFYSRKPSKCRKLHNITDSVVIFDEVQAIPVERVKPCLEVIQELSLHYGVTSVLCTATQPVFEYSDSFQSGLKNIREIIQNVSQLFSELKRTEENYIGKLSEAEIANRILQHRQVLCVVNTRQNALDIFKALPESDENIHLSALMYPAHRTRQLDEIRNRLKAESNLPCRVVSTQLIEAGVDIDFPSVYRVVAGIDSIAQASGRCNRNGFSKTLGKVSVFDLAESTGCSFVRQAAQSAKKLFKPFEGRLTDPVCVKEYFADYYWKNEQRMDEGEIVKKCSQAQTLNIQFKDIAEFRMIQSATEPIIIALDKDAVQLVNSLKTAKYTRSVLRKLQQYSVQIYPYQLDEIKDWLENPVPGVWVLRTREMYSSSTGLKCKQPEGNAFFG